MNGKIICLESLDGAGKSTQINLIKDFFENKKIKCTHVHFPIYEENEPGKIIASYLRGEYGNLYDVNPLFIANTYAMNRYLYLAKFKKMIAENDIILLDRYVFSNMAYQGAKYDNETDVKTIINWIYNFEFKFLKLPYPDLTLFLNVPVDIIEKRLLEKREGEDREYLNGKNDIHEMNIEFQKKVHFNYANFKYKNYKNINCIDKNLNLLNPKSVFELCMHYIGLTIF